MNERRSIRLKNNNINLSEKYLASLFKRLFKKKEVKKLTIEDIRKGLIEANEILREIGVTAWITDGTLLGYFRENDLIAHDFDADLGCMIENYSEDIVYAFRERGWELAYVWGEIKQGLELTFRKGQVKIDIFFFYKDSDDRLWHGAWRKHDKKSLNLIKYYYEPFELKEVDFLDARFNIPKDTLKYITTKYGPGWKTPQKNWSWIFGPANAVETDVVIPKNKKKRIV